jgi:hypothetical protein
MQGVGRSEVRSLIDLADAEWGCYAYGEALIAHVCDQTAESLDPADEPVYRRTRHGWSVRGH